MLALFAVSIQERWPTLIDHGGFGDMQSGDGGGGGSIKRQCSILGFISTSKSKEDALLNEQCNKENNQQEFKVLLDPPSSSSFSDVALNDFQADAVAVNRYEWLVNIRDKDGRPPTSQDYDPSSLFIPDSQWDRFTPFEKQYWKIKSEYFDSVVFFKKGKFFELYENDADLAGGLFDLKVTERTNMKMAGVPEMSLAFWACRFVNAGYNAILHPSDMLF